MASSFGSPFVAGEWGRAAVNFLATAEPDCAVLRPAYSSFSPTTGIVGEDDGAGFAVQRALVPEWRSVTGQAGEVRVVES